MVLDVHYTSHPPLEHMHMYKLVEMSGKLCKPYNGLQSYSRSLDEPLRLLAADCEGLNGS